MGETVVVTSGKGGVGKTTTSANLGAALALLGKKVCLVDTDIGLRNLDVVLGMENRIVYDLVDVVTGQCRLEAALIKDKRFDNLTMLAASQTKDKSALTPEAVKKVIDELKPSYDYVIIDCPAGIEQGFKIAIAGAERAIVVTTAENAAVRDADRVIGLLEAAKIKHPKLIINRVRPHMMQQGDMLDIEDITSLLAIDLLGVVPDDEFVIASANRGEPAVVNPNSRAAIAYRNIARRILGDSVPLMILDEKRSFMGRIKQIFGTK
ncbi:MAG: cell division inhibitor MinD [Bacilli bacterium]|nr:cell division inhibitor MinD [Bacilli bacterium]